jgi:hypothetical protein
MVFSEVISRIAERRAELDVLEEQLVGRLAEVRAERDELAVAEKVLARFDLQASPEPPVSAPVGAHIAGRAVLLVPHRAAGMEDTALPEDYRRILALVRAVGGPVATRQVGDGLGVDTENRGKLEPLRGKLTKLADRGWLRKLPDGRFTILP